MKNLEKKSMLEESQKLILLIGKYLPRPSDGNPHMSYDIKSDPILGEKIHQIETELREYYRPEWFVYTSSVKDSNIAMRLNFCYEKYCHLAIHSRE